MRPAGFAESRKRTRRIAEPGAGLTSMRTLGRLTGTTVSSTTYQHRSSDWKRSATPPAWLLAQASAANAAAKAARRLAEPGGGSRMGVSDQAIGGGKRRCSLAAGNTEPCIESLETRIDGRPAHVHVAGNLLRTEAFALVPQQVDVGGGELRPLNELLARL